MSTTSQGEEEREKEKEEKTYCAVCGDDHVKEGTRAELVGDCEYVLCVDLEASGELDTEPAQLRPRGILRAAALQNEEYVLRGVGHEGLEQLLQGHARLDLDDAVVVLEVVKVYGVP
jgi:hypothetical protein